MLITEWLLATIHVPFLNYYGGLVGCLLWRTWGSQTSFLVLRFTPLLKDSSWPNPSMPEISYIGLVWNQVRVFLLQWPSVPSHFSTLMLISTLILHYWSIIGSLQYLTMTRPTLSFSVNTDCQFMQNSTMGHYRAVKRILRYVRGTINFGIHILANSTLDLYGFSDADCTGCPNTRRSTTGFCTFLGANCISLSAKKQPTVAWSCTEAEFRAMASTTAELT